VDNHLDSNNTSRVAPKKLRNRSNILGVVLSLLIIVGLIVGAYFIINARKSNKVANKGVIPCTQDKALIAGFLLALRENKRSELKSIYDSTKSNPSLNTDVNCLYIVSRSAIYFGDANESVEYVGQLKKIYSDNNKFDQSIISSGDSLNTLVAESDFLKKQSENLNSNATFGGVTRQGAQ